MIATEKELASAIQAYASVHGRFSANDLERVVTPQMSPELRCLFDRAGRIERYRAMLRAPKHYGINQFISLGEDQYAHQTVLTFEEWTALAEETASSTRRSIGKLRRIAYACERCTGKTINVDELIRRAVS